LRVLAVFVSIAAIVVRAAARGSILRTNRPSHFVIAHDDQIDQSSPENELRQLKAVPSGRYLQQMFNYVPCRILLFQDPKAIGERSDRIATIRKFRYWLFA
jgi:hypothetical protein